MGNEDMEPMDHYVALKGHRGNWIKEMQDHGLNDEEQQALISLLDENDGCSIEYRRWSILRSLAVTRSWSVSTPKTHPLNTRCGNATG